MVLTAWFYGFFLAMLATGCIWSHPWWWNWLVGKRWIYLALCGLHVWTKRNCLVVCSFFRHCHRFVFFFFFFFLRDFKFLWLAEAISLHFLDAQWDFSGDFLFFCTAFGLIFCTLRTVLKVHISRGISCGASFFEVSFHLGESYIWMWEKREGLRGSHVLGTQLSVSYRFSRR